MLKQTIDYVDFDNNKRTETLYFNISKSDLLDNLDLKDRLQSITDSLSGETRDLTEKEIREIIELVKLFMKLSYGIRSEDGRRFKKSEDIWQEFTETAAYDAFLMSLFEVPTRAIEFLVGVVPQDLRAQAEAELKNVDSPYKQAIQDALQNSSEPSIFARPKTTESYDELTQPQSSTPSIFQNNPNG